MATIDSIKQRNFRESDLPQIIEFKRKSNKVSFPGKKLDADKFSERLLKCSERSPECVQVLEKDGEVIGYIWFSCREGYNGKYGRVKQLFIEENSRRLKLAEALVGHAEKHLASIGAKSMRLAVTETNVPAIRFYGKMKYKKTRIIMEKRL